VFTGNTINLATVVNDLTVGVDLVRDGQFSYVGKVPTELERRVVPATTAQHIEAASAQSGVVGVITRPELASLVPSDKSLLISEEPVTAALLIHEKLCAIDGFLWESFDSRIDPSARVHKSAVIAERDVVIGPGAEVGPTSVVLERSVIEGGAHVGVGVVVGLDAFEIFEGANPRRILKQAGGVWLESGATVLAHCTLVRATFGGFTRLCRGAMVDVLVHVAHDVTLEDNSTVVACAEVSGRCTVGEGAYIGPNACIRNGITVGSNATVSMGAVVTRDVADDATVSGNFAVPHEQWLGFVKSLSRKA
jgi:UDP-3-O-[3-hydroxymyristoyl] glucosamine N-acyltransferase